MIMISNLGVTGIIFQPIIKHFLYAGKAIITCCFFFLVIVGKLIKHGVSQNSLKVFKKLEICNALLLKMTCLVRIFGCFPPLIFTAQPKYLHVFSA
jgi:hypothetical protein